MFRTIALTLLTLSDQYIMVMLVVLVLTVLAVMRNSVLTNFLASIGWFISMVLNFSLSANSSIQIAFGYLSLILGAIFIIASLSGALSMMNERSQRKTTL